jgi:hypothetical protein
MYPNIKLKTRKTAAPYQKQPFFLLFMLIGV